MASYRRGWRPGVLFPSRPGRCRRGKPARRSEFFALSRAVDRSPFGSLFMSSTAFPTTPIPGQRAGIWHRQRNTTPRWNEPQALTACEPVSLPSQLHSHNGRNWTTTGPEFPGPTDSALFSRGCLASQPPGLAPRSRQGGNWRGFRNEPRQPAAATICFALPANASQAAHKTTHALGGSNEPPSDVPDIVGRLAEKRGSKERGGRGDRVTNHVTTSRACYSVSRFTQQRARPHLSPNITCSCQCITKSHSQPTDWVLPRSRPRPARSLRYLPVQEERTLPRK